MNALGGENTESRSITPEVRDALRAAFEAQAEAVRMARNEVFDNAAQAAAAQAGSPAAAGGSTGIQSPISGEGMGGGGVSNEPIGDADAIPIDWGRLPPRVARDLRDSLREGTASEYRDQVNAYFRLVAEQAAASAR